MADGELQQAIKPAPSGFDLDALLVEIRPAMRRLARAVVRSRRAGDIDDLCQLGMVEAARRFPEWNPAQTASFMQFISAYARGVMLNSILDDARELAMARTMHRAAQLVLNQVDPGDYLTEPEAVRKERYNEARAASSAAAVVVLTRETPEEQLMSAQEGEKLRAVVEAALAALDVVERTLVFEYVVEERAIVDIAQEVGLEYDKARYRLAKALVKLGERVKRGLGPR
jgi:RNA polymerase sigma factor (sigma-70 family)